MKYIGEFKSVDEKYFKIEITTKSSGSDTKLLLSDTPFVANISDEDNYIYSPVKSGGATVGLLMSNFNPDFYAPNATDVKVTLYKEDIVEWTGFVVPTCYDQEFESNYDELQLDCVDGIAALKDIQYTRIESVNGVVSFWDVIYNCFSKVNCYQYLYVSDNVRYNQNQISESIIEKLYINQEAFFDKRSDADQTDDDLAISCFDVLYQLSQFLGYTLLAQGNSVYMIDYDAIKAGNNSYYQYNFNNAYLIPKNTVILDYNKFIDENDRGGSGDSISLDVIYNKVTVKDTFAKCDNLFPQFSEDLYCKNITDSNDDDFNNWAIWKNEYVYDTDITYGGANANTDDQYWKITDSFIDTISGEAYQAGIVQPVHSKNKYIVVAKFCNSEIAKFIRYDANTDDKVVMLDPVKGIGFSTVQKTHGAFYIKLFKKQIEDDDWEKLSKIHKQYVGTDGQNTTNEARLQAWVHMLNTRPSKLNFENYIISINNNSLGHRINKDINGGKSYQISDAGFNYYGQYPVLEWTAPAISLGGQNAAIVISGTILSHDEIITPFPMTDGSRNDKLKYHGDTKYYYGFYLWAKLQIGEYFWDGYNWDKKDTGFKLYWNEKYPDISGELKVTEYFDKAFKIFNTHLMNVLVDTDGYYIPVPDDIAIYGDAKFTLYANRDIDGYDKQGWSGFDSAGYDRSRYRSDVICIKDFKIKPYIINGILSEAINDSDTVYTNVVDNNAVSKMGDIEFKVCTFDNKSINYSSVLYKKDADFEYVKNFYNNALYLNEYQTMGVDKENAKLRQEEHYVFKLVTQYSQPRIIFQCNLHEDSHKLYGLYTNKTLSGRNFIISGYETDYKNNQQTLNLKQIL